MKLSAWLKGTLVAVVLIVLGCGGGETKEIPSPADPSAPPQELTPPAPTTDPRLPDLSHAVPINLHDKTTYQGLQDLAKTVFPPLVGDPLVSMRLTNTRDTNISGSILIAFEDRMGFWGASLDSFEGTGYRDSQRLDIIFADDEFALRAVGALSIDDLTGVIYYRLRQTGDTQCKKFICTGWGCPTSQDLASICRTYMNTTDAHVKELGTFRTKYSNWTR